MVIVLGSEPITAVVLGCYLHDLLTSDTLPCGNLEWCRRDFINAVWIVPDLIRHFNVSGWPVKLSDLIHGNCFTLHKCADNARRDSIYIIIVEQLQLFNKHNHARNTSYYTVESPNKGHFGTVILSFVRRLSFIGKS